MAFCRKLEKEVSVSTLFCTCILLLQPLIIIHQVCVWILHARLLIISRCPMVCCIIAGRYSLEMCGNRIFVPNPSHFNDFIPIPIWYLNPIPIFPIKQFHVPSHCTHRTWRATVYSFGKTALLVTVWSDFFPLPRLNSHSYASYSHSHPTAYRSPIPMGIPWDPWDPSLSHSHHPMHISNSQLSLKPHPHWRL